AQVKKEAMSSTIITDLTTSSAPRYIPMGLKSCAITAGVTAPAAALAPSSTLVSAVETNVCSTACTGASVLSANDAGAQNNRNSNNEREAMCFIRATLIALANWESKKATNARHKERNCR